MELEVGDLFIVTRGSKIAKNAFLWPFGLSGNETESWKGGGEQDDEPRYDRSYGDRVFKVHAVAGPIVAVEMVSGSEWPGGRTKFMFNTREIEVWPCGQEFLDAMQEKGETK